MNAIDWCGMVICFLLTACSLPAPVSPRHDRVAWGREPTVGTDDEALRPVVQQAIAAWGWGRLVETCESADICVARDALEGAGDSWGRASWRPDGPARCRVAVMVETFGVVAHELGHCFGLGHSADRRSVMYRRARGAHVAGLAQFITLSDRDALTTIRRSTRRDIRSQVDPWSMERSDVVHTVVSTVIEGED